MEALTHLTIERLSDEGRGIAHHGGKVCFVAGALPGERVAALRVGERARFAEYRVEHVESASALRVAPGCPLFGRCGGCDLQHLDPEAQCRHKSDVVLAALSRHAGLEPARVDAPIVSSAYGYRARARFAIDAPRGGPFTLGFREAGSNDVVGVASCPVLVPALSALPSALGDCLSALERPRALGHVDLSLSESDRGSRAVVGVRVVAAPTPADRERLADFAARHGAYLALETEDALDWIARPDDEPPGYLLPDYALRIAYAPGDFIQGNLDVNRALVRRVVEWLEPAPRLRVMDAFCGLGNFALPLARAGAEVAGFEISRRMVDAAVENATRHGIVNASFAVRDLHDETGARLPAGRYDAVVLDPPRAGAPALAAEIARRAIPRVLYVSCLPSALARDAKTLAAAGYRLERFGFVDMFPQTAHVESMALFVHAKKARGSR